MWVLFAIMLETEFELFSGDHLGRLGFGDFDTEANWPIFFERLTPFLVTTGVLVYLLTAGILTLRRRRLALLRPPPAPLDLETECREAGLNETTLLAARSARIIVVHIGSQGNVEIEIQRARM